MTPMLRLATILCLLFCAGYPPNLAAQAPESQQEIPAVALVDLSTPRATVQTFFRAMIAFKAGNVDRLGDAVNCIYLGDDLEPEERLNQGSSPAYIIFAVMDGLQFDMELIDDNPSERNLKVTLGEGEGSFDLYLRRYDDDLWRISSQSLKPDYLAALEEIVAERESIEGEEEGGFVLALKSPRVTMEAFIKGMNETDGFTVADAINTLDLSEVSEVDRESVGLGKVSDLKALIDRIKLIEFSEIPPDSDGETYVFFQDPTGLGSIVLAPVPDEDEPEMKAWRFTKGTLESLEPLYLKYKDEPLVAGLQPKTDVQPLGNRIRDWIHGTYPSLLEKPFYLKNYQWLGLLILIFIGILFSRLLTLLIGFFIRFWFRRKGFAYDKKLEREFIRPIQITLMAWIWLYGIDLLQLASNVLEHLRIAAFFVTAAGAVWASYRLIDIVGKYLTGKALESESKYDDLLVPIIVRTLKIFVVVVGIVALAGQMTSDPTKLLTGLGLGGLAFALAAKDVVANIFGSITILADRPFRIGDWVTIGDIDGSVESVGIRSTRIRTFYNSLITVPNSEIVGSHIDNMGARRYRRIKTTLAITYDTPPETIEAFCEGIRELIRTHPYTRKDYFHVYLNGFSESSLDIMLYCFVETPDWGTELREKHRLYLDIIRLAEALKVSFAFPTQTLFLNKEEAAVLAGGSPADGPRAGVMAARGIVAQTLGKGGAIPPPVTFGSSGDMEIPVTEGEDDE